jgi:Predicted periplasmic lipoprotein (DUF2279)
LFNSPDINYAKKPAVLIMKCCRFFLSIYISFFLCSVDVNAQTAADSVSTYQPARGRKMAIGMGAAYVGGMAGLYKLWYEDYSSSGFHFFDDKNEWKNMDKFGHIGSAYYISRWSSDLIKWTGHNARRSDWKGTGVSFLFLTSIELFDAYSDNWGFSVSDMLTNVGGCALYMGQQLAWREQRITFKFSYVPTDFANYRPDALGSTSVERLFKDYNGQTYWLSFNIASFLPESTHFPKWLNLAAGYGANGMVTAYEQVFEIDRVIFKEEDRIRQYYLSADIDLTRIQWKSKFLRTFSGAIGFIKFPLPALRWDQRGRMEFMPLGF